MKAVGKKKECLNIIDVTNEVPQISNLVQVISQLKRIMKKLVLLKMFKSRNRRIKWLWELANKYLKMLVLEKPSKRSTSILGMSVSSADSLSSNADMVIEPVIDITKVSIDKEVEDDCFPETSLKASTSGCYEALCLKGLPHRFHMPAPRMLCRPSALRWTKPCCTRSCNESLEHIITINYSECQKSYSKLA
ncbi:TP53-target gene 5 protein isoform X2 [Pantherophis guttatus]|uniref:TP53-target gene 5 protein isoform X2 n=1 Tax=Pantherophis guttatus TaxID=94885 RepID=A0ABM3ZB01_PANGU|nr:TP53-target gene 5 protein isoform X2 [Pantherophis guttatus]